MIPLQQARHQATLAMQSLRKQRGMRSHLARSLGLRFQTTTKWKVVPLDHVFAVAALVRISVEELRPDFFREDPLRADRFAAQKYGTGAHCRTPPDRSIEAEALRSAEAGKIVAALG